MKNLEKTIVFISNPFGYGPTGTLVPIIQEFVKKLKTPIIFLGSGLCLEPIQNFVDKKFIKLMEIDERNTHSIKDNLQKIENPYLISSLNRFGIVAANKINIPNALIDPLGWFWKSLPSGFEKADIYFYNSLGKKNNFQFNKKIEIPLIVTKPISKTYAERRIVFNLGGLKNPLIRDLQKNYLKLTHYLIKNISQYYQRQLTVAGGKDAINYLTRLDKISPSGAFYKSFTYEKFSDILSNSKLVITPAGMSVSFSALYLNKPVVFFLSENMSQENLVELFKKNNLTNSAVDWPNSFREKINNESEKEYIKSIEVVSEEILKDKLKLSKLSDMLNSLIEKESVNKNLIRNNELLEYGGEKDIFEYLVKAWNLPGN